MYVDFVWKAELQGLRYVSVVVMHCITTIKPGRLDQAC